jgi:predicted nuclease with TOPRIM domain
MKERLEQRLTKLKAEYEAGQKMLADLEAKAADLRETLLRISGAIQVLEEELDQTQEPESGENPIAIPGNGASETA